MNKAILIMDMPTLCSDCVCYRAGSLGTEWPECKVPLKVIDYIKEANDIARAVDNGTRPPWCPLIPINDKTLPLQLKWYGMEKE